MRNSSSRAPNGHGWGPLNRKPRPCCEFGMRLTWRECGDRDALEPERPGVDPRAIPGTGGEVQAELGRPVGARPARRSGDVPQPSGPAEPIDRRPERQRRRLPDRDPPPPDRLGCVGVPGQSGGRRRAESREDRIQRAGREVEPDHRRPVERDPFDPARRRPLPLDPLDPVGEGGSPLPNLGVVRVLRRAEGRQRGEAHRLQRGRGRLALGVSRCAELPHQLARFPGGRLAPARPPAPARSPSSPALLVQPRGRPLLAGGSAPHHTATVCDTESRQVGPNGLP